MLLTIELKIHYRERNSYSFNHKHEHHINSHTFSVIHLGHGMNKINPIKQM